MPHDESTSASLLQRIANLDDWESWAIFIARYEPMIRNWCSRWDLQQTDIEDRTQEVLLNVAKAIRSFQYDSSKSFCAWLRTIVNNELRDLLEQLGYRRDHGDVGTGAPHDLAETIFGQLDLDLTKRVNQVFTEAAKRVTPRDWQIWQASMMEGQPDREIAGALGKTRGAIHQAKHRVKETIEEIVE